MFDHEYKSLKELEKEIEDKKAVQDRDNLKRRILRICKAWAVFKQTRSQEDEGRLDDSIIQAERLTR